MPFCNWCPMPSADSPICANCSLKTLAISCQLATIRGDGIACHVTQVVSNGQRLTAELSREAAVRRSSSGASLTRIRPRAANDAGFEASRRVHDCRLDTRSKHALLSKGIMTLEQAAAIPLERLRKTPKLGPVSFERVCALLVEEGLLDTKAVQALRAVG